MWVHHNDNKTLSYRREIALQGRGLGETHAVDLRVIGKLSVDFQLVIIDLFFR